jgi:hypothetical protein
VSVPQNLVTSLYFVRAAKSLRDQQETKLDIVRVIRCGNKELPYSDLLEIFLGSRWDLIIKFGS